MKEKKEKLDYIEKEDKRTIGGGEYWNNHWLKDKKLGLYSEKYRVKTVGKWLSDIAILYDLKEFKPEYGYSKQLRTIKFSDLGSLTDAIFCYIMYQH